MLAVHGEVEPGNDVVAVQEWHDEVTPALALRHVDLEPEVKTPERQRPVAITDQVVEGRQQGRPRLERPGLDLPEQRHVFAVHEPVALESDLHRNDHALGFEVLPRARESLVAAPDEMVLHLLLRGDAQRTQGADGSVAKRSALRWYRSQRRSEPCIRQGPSSPSSGTACGHDPSLEP